MSGRVAVPATKERRPGRSLARAWLVLLLLTAGLGPLLANDSPLVARVAGDWRFPAFATYAGRSESGPDAARALTWREWWLQSPGKSSEWAIMPPWPYGPLQERNLQQRNQSPSWSHPLGTDGLGRDLLARLIWGASSAVLVAAGTVLLAFALGLPLGMLSAAGGRTLDAVVSWCSEVCLCFPALFLALVAGVFFGRSTLTVILVLGILAWPAVARLVRGELLSLREREFVLAARGLGVRPLSLWFRHLLPCIRGPMVEQMAFLFAGAIVAESALAFLGLGAGNESWGAMLDGSRDGALRGVWHLWVFPALAVATTVWSLHAAFDRADPKQVTAWNA